VVQWKIRSRHLRDAAVAAPVDEPPWGNGCEVRGCLNRADHRIYSREVCSACLPKVRPSDERTARL
jgi:hypothetical protein